MNCQKELIFAKRSWTHWPKGAVKDDGVSFGTTPRPGFQSPPGLWTIFSRESQPKPSFETVSGWGVDRRYHHFIHIYFCLWCGFILSRWLTWLNFFGITWFRGGNNKNLFFLIFMARNGRISYMRSRWAWTIPWSWIFWPYQKEWFMAAQPTPPRLTYHPPRRQKGFMIRAYENPLVSLNKTF